MSQKNNNDGSQAQQPDSIGRVLTEFLEVDDDLDEHDVFVYPPLES